MGDRANFGFRKDEDSATLFLYLHSGGYRMMQHLATALVKAFPRWDSPSYATRICVSSLFPNHYSETGGGLYIDEIGDNEHSIPIVDWNLKEVWLYDEDQILTGSPKFKIGLAKFINKYGAEADKADFYDAGGRVPVAPDAITFATRMKMIGKTVLVKRANDSSLVGRTMKVTGVWNYREPRYKNVDGITVNVLPGGNGHDGWVQSYEVVTEKLMTQDEWLELMCKAHPNMALALRYLAESA